MVTPLGRLGRNLRDLLLDALDHLHRVFASAHHDHPADYLTPIHIERAAPEVASNRNLSDIFKVNRKAILRTNGDAPKIIEAVNQPDTAHDKLHAILFDDLPADVDIAVGERIHDLAQVHARLPHFPRVDGHLILAHKAADAGDFRDAFDRRQLIPDEQILQRTKCSQIKATESSA